MSEHGGARPGAGRPRREVPRATLSVRLEPKTLDYLREAAAARGMSQAELVTELVRRLRAADRPQH